MPKKENIDAFWDIEELLPPRQKKPPVTHKPADTSAAEISLSPAPEKEAPLRIPPRKEISPPKAPSALREYKLEAGLIQGVRVLPWPTVFGFYEKFKKDALRNFEREHGPCDYVYFFSYMPQYDQMTVSQMAYYLYWRAEIRKGIYLKTDINYLFLYAYEIINLPEKIPPKKGAILLSRLWGAYRDDFHYLDKYLGEWLCDYCLIHGVSPDWNVLDIFAGEVASKVSLPEFYLKDRYFPFSLIAATATYDYQKSKYYEKYHEAYDKHIPAAMEYAVNRVIASDFETFGIIPAKTTRDSFSGAVACHAVKYKLEVTRYALRRAIAKNGCDLKQIFSGMIKLCENQLRSVFGIKSRFSPTGVENNLKEAIAAYFEKAYPNRNQRKTFKEEEEEAYMALYEPIQKGPADINRALAIEKEAWETAALLATDEDEELFEESLIPPMTEPEKDIFAEEFSLLSDEEDEFDFLHTLSEEEKGALLAALHGNFSEYCRRIGKMEETMRAAINEISAEALGDMLIESDFSVVEDYSEDISRILETH